jgi:hypothetical protein
MSNITKKIVINPDLFKIKKPTVSNKTIKIKSNSPTEIKSKSRSLFRKL